MTMRVGEFPGCSFQIIAPGLYKVCGSLLPARKLESLLQLVQMPPLSHQCIDIKLYANSFNLGFKYLSFIHHQSSGSCHREENTYILKEDKGCFSLVR